MSLPASENGNARLADGNARLADGSARLADGSARLADGQVGVPGVWRYLDGLGNDDGLAGPDLHRLAAAWRVLLHLHDGEPGGECARCSHGHRGSCTVWQVATGYLARRARW